MPPDWQLARQERVQANRYVPLPSPVRDAVVSDHPVDGPSVTWHYDEHSRYVVLAAGPLAGRNYVDVGRYKVYETDGDVARIRPPDAVVDRVAPFAEGDRVMYLAYESMTRAAVPSTYLLTTTQLLSLLPDDEVDATVSEGSSDLRAAVLETPGFLPAV